MNLLQVTQQQTSNCTYQVENDAATTQIASCPKYSGYRYNTDVGIKPKTVSGVFNGVQTRCKTLFTWVVLSRS